MKLKELLDIIPEDELVLIYEKEGTYNDLHFNTLYKGKASKQKLVKYGGYKVNHLHRLSVGNEYLNIGVEK